MGQDVHHLNGDAFHAILDEMHDAVIVRDFNDRIAYWNKGAERLYGWGAHEVAGQNIYDVLLQKDPPFSGERQQAIQETGEWLGELRQVTKDRRDIVVNSRWKIIRDDAGQPQFVLIVNTDITEKKELESHLLSAQRMETIGRLACSIGHDLANALAPMYAATRILRRRQLDEETRQSIKNLQAGGKYAARLIAQLLAFGKGVEKEHNSIDPGYLVKRFVPILRSSFPHSIEIKTVFGRGLWSVSGNMTNLHQLLMNICLNARDAMRSGGTLTIRTENVILEKTSRRHICIKVIDTGSGIKPEMMDKIMNPFFTTREKGGGTGLGLFSVSRIVKDHSGFIKVSSEPAKGTQFEIYLPAED
jgi:PAS domain S-box-containing protein